jgi:DDE domain
MQQSRTSHPPPQADLEDGSSTASSCTIGLKVTVGSTLIICRRRSRLRQVRYLNNIVKQDHRNAKRLTRPGLGFGSLWTARRTLVGYEAMAMMRKGPVPKHRRQRHPDPGNVHRRTISCRRLRGELGPLADDPRPKPKRCNRARGLARAHRRSLSHIPFCSRPAPFSLEGFFSWQQISTTLAC